VQRALSPMFTAAPGSPGFACEATLALATDTIGFTQ
jgi:hypothetical protein